MKNQHQLVTNKRVNYKIDYDKQFLSSKMSDLYVDAFSSIMHKAKPEDLEDTVVSKTFKE